MKEDFLYFLWQCQQFNKDDLRTTDGETLHVLKIGQQNHDAGADFEEARLLIAGVEWAGSVEMHLRSSDWELHRHQHNKAYENVILHVVWEHNQTITRQDGSAIPTIELKYRTDVALLQKYEAILDNKYVIPCQEHFERVNSLSIMSMLDKALSQRLEQKANNVTEIWERNLQDFEETAYQFLGKNFGFKINGETFLQLTETLSLKILRKHAQSNFQLEALLFGQAGFLDDPSDDYGTSLQSEYHFLSEKYGLKTAKLAKHQWKFLRLRPANFPTIRLAQFAQLIQQTHSIFSLFTETPDYEGLIKKIRVQQSDYWTTHYVFGEATKATIGGLGRSSAENIIINTVIPLLAFSGVYFQKEELIERAIKFLESLPAEQNRITQKWEQIGLKIKTAFDSQATYQLYHAYCLDKKCVHCAIGTTILKP